LRSCRSPSHVSERLRRAHLERARLPFIARGLRPGCLTPRRGPRDDIDALHDARPEGLRARRLTRMRGRPWSEVSRPRSRASRGMGGEPSARSLTPVSLVSYSRVLSREPLRRSDTVAAPGAARIWRRGVFVGSHAMRPGESPPTGVRVGAVAADVSCVM